MIRHIVFFRAKQRDDIPAILAGLSLLKEIPHATKLEVALNNKIDQVGNDVDIVVYGEFADLTEFDAYKAHPLYEESTRRVRPLRDTRVAADYDVLT